MMLALALLVPTGLLLPAAMPPREDQAHRLDHMQTRLLNERARDRLRNETIRSGAAIKPGLRASPEQALREREERAIERWRAEHPQVKGAPGG